MNHLVQEVQQLTSELPVGRVTRSVSKSVSALSRCSDGARQSDEFDKRCIGDLNAWTSSSC